MCIYNISVGTDKYGYSFLNFCFGGWRHAGFLALLFSAETQWAGLASTINPVVLIKITRTPCFHECYAVGSKWLYFPFGSLLINMCLGFRFAPPSSICFVELFLPLCCIRSSFHFLTPRTKATKTNKRITIQSFWAVSELNQCWYAWWSVFEEDLKESNRKLS